MQLKVLKVSFLDVGQGDAIFIETPSGRQVLVDAGPHTNVLRALGTVMPFYDREIDVVLVTHPDADHIGGFQELFRRFDINVVLDTGATNDTQVYTSYRDAVVEEGASYVKARRGQVIDFNDGTYIRVLFPDRELDEDIGNDGSVVVQVVYGETEVLLSGDAGQNIERLLVSLEGGMLASDILKAGHHGSKSSSASVFVTTVDPEISIISAECDSRYGHPHQEVMTLLSQISEQVLGTCEHGTITFISDGQSFRRK